MKHKKVDSGSRKCDMQQACRGLIPQRTGNIKDEEGHPCTMSEAKEQQ